VKEGAAISSDRVLVVSRGEQLHPRVADPAPVMMAASRRDGHGVVSLELLLALRAKTVLELASAPEEELLAEDRPHEGHTQDVSDSITKMHRETLHRTKVDHPVG
jgi:hypothetical protein